MMMTLVSRSEQDGVVSVPAKGSVSSSVRSVVHMVRASVGGGRVRGSIGLATTGLAVLTVGLGGNLITILLLHLSGLSGEAGHSEHRDGGSSEAGHVHVLDGDDEVARRGGHRGHGGAERDQDLRGEW